MKTINDLLSFAARLDETKERISGILCAIRKYLAPVLKNDEMLDVTILDINEVTSRKHGVEFSQRTHEAYRERSRYILKKFKRHIEFGDVPLVAIGARVNQDSLLRSVKADLYGNVQVTISAEELDVLIRALEAVRRKLPGLEQ